MNSRRFFFLLLAASFALSMLGVIVVNATSGADNKRDSNIKFYQYRNQLGAGGYDVVAYFEENLAVKGDGAFEAAFAGEVWHFASEENRDKFTAAPKDYLPQYGGHCAYGVAQGYLVRGAPTAWSIKDGKLYLNYNKNIRSAWLANAQGFIRRSENNWPQLND